VVRVFGGETDWAAAERRVDDWQAGLEQRAAHARQLSGELAQLSATARSDDGLVEVRVGPSGQMLDLQLADGVRQQRATTTARQILSTIRAAHQELMRLAGETTAATVGPDSDTGRAVMASLARQLDTGGQAGKHEPGGADGLR
jgi:DNA-binding protein YbaB